MVRLTVFYGDYLLEQLTPLISALPFKEEKKCLACHSKEETEEDRENENVEMERDQIEDRGAMRVTTRARLAYNLEGYSKNAMLIFDAINYQTPSNMEFPDRIEQVAATFRRLRFEIQIYLNLTDEQIDQTCQEFFQRDFSDCGCVAVVGLSLDGKEYNDALVVRHWTSAGNPTLRDKPKLYIKEVNHMRGYRYTQMSRSRDHAPISVDHPDVLFLRLPVLFHHNIRQPLEIFCEKLIEMTDVDDLMTVTRVTVQETKPIIRGMIYVASTLGKQLFLPRTENAEITRICRDSVDQVLSLKTFIKSKFQKMLRLSLTGVFIDLSIAYDTV